MDHSFPMHDDITGQEWTLGTEGVSFRYTINDKNHNYFKTLQAYFVCCDSITMQKSEFQYGTYYEALERCNDYYSTIMCKP